VLSVAQQQRLAVCAALLKEVALSYGFALSITEGVEEAEEDYSGMTLYWQHRRITLHSDRV
jgi:hypothetical protein